MITPSVPHRVPQEFRLRTANLAVVAYATLGRMGCVAIRVAGSDPVRQTIPCPPGTYPADRWDEMRPIISGRAAFGRIYLGITLNEDSGVYGYRYFRIYMVRRGGLTLVAHKEFSDYGAWKWESSPFGYQVWDYIFAVGREAHRAPHRYHIERFRIKSVKSSLMRVSNTKGKYDPGWDSSGGTEERPARPQSDPLREIGQRWSWWGIRED